MMFSDPKTTVHAARIAYYVLKPRPIREVRVNRRYGALFAAERITLEQEEYMWGTWCERATRGEHEKPAALYETLGALEVKMCIDRPHNTYSCPAFGMYRLLISNFWGSRSSVLRLQYLVSRSR